MFEKKYDIKDLYIAKVLNVEDVYKVGKKDVKTSHYKYTIVLQDKLIINYEKEKENKNFCYAYKDMLDDVYYTVIDKTKQNSKQCLERTLVPLSSYIKIKDKNQKVTKKQLQEIFVSILLGLEEQVNVR